MTTVIETEALRREFGELVAVDGVSLSMAADEITSIIGPNGAGKTTFYNLLTGVLKPTSGRVWLRHEDELVEITGLPPHEIAQHGLSRSYQVINIFDGLTVSENVLVARISRANRTLDFTAAATADEAINERVEEILTLTNLTDVTDERCGTLSHGVRRQVEIALALAIDPTVVLLDEPTAGMNPTETREVVELVRDLDRRTDTTFVVTEHDMDVVFDISDRIIVFHEGAVLADGDPETVRTDESVMEAYLGGEVP